MSKGNGVLCSDSQQCLTSGSGPRCVGPVIEEDTLCDKPEGCYCFKKSKLRKTDDVESIHCKTGMYCSYDYDGPFALRQSPRATRTPSRRPLKTGVSPAPSGRMLTAP